MSNVEQDTAQGKDTGTAEIVIYRGQNAEVAVRFQSEEAWATQAQIAAIYNRSVKVVSHHITNILAEGELSRAAVVSEYEITAADGKNYDVDHFALDMVLAVGFRVKSPEATRYRQWAIAELKKRVRGETGPSLSGEAIASFCTPIMERMFDSFERRLEEREARLEAKLNATFEARLLEAKATDPRVAVVDFEGSLEVCDAEHIPPKGRGGFQRSLSTILMRTTLEKGMTPRILAFGKNRILQFPVAVTRAWRDSDAGRAWVAMVKRTLTLRQNGQQVLPFPVGGRDGLKAKKTL